MEKLKTQQEALVKSTVGEATFSHQNNTLPISDGVRIPLGAEIEIADGAELLLEYADGSLVTLPDNLPSVPMDEEIPGLSDEIAAIQDLILGGDDPTEELPATAAGGNNASGGGFGFTSVNRDGAETLAEAGYETEGVEPRALGRGDESEDDAAFFISNAAEDSPAPGGDGGTGLPIAVESISSPNVSEGDNAIFTVTLSQATTASTTVILNLAGGSANAGTDFKSATVTVNGEEVQVAEDGSFAIIVAPGETSFDVVVETIDDSVSENNESFTLSASTVGQDGAVTGTGTIEDDKGTTPGTEDTVRVNISGPDSVVEGETTGKYTVSLTQKAETPVTVKLTYSGTATDGTDYTKVVDVVIPAGQDKVEFDITTLDDAIADNGETITVTLGDITGGGFEAIEAGANNSVTTVINDQTGTDGTPGTEDTVRVNISGPDSVVEGETTGKYTVSLTQKAETPVTVKLTYSGTATDGTDYTKVVDVVIPAGQDKVEFDITTLDDAIADNGETITVTLGDITGGGFEAIEAGANNSVTTVINDQTGTDGTPGTEDTVRVNISGPDSVVEGETTGKYTVSLTQKAETPVTVKLTYSGTATDGTDYTKVVDVVIPAGQDKVEFDITTLDDAIADNGETITVTLGDITGGGFEAIEAGANNSVTTVINDQTGTDGTPGTEDTVRVNISGPDSVVEGETTGKYTVSLTQKAETPVTVKLTYSGTATDGTDYTKVVDVVIPAGQDKVEFDITTLDDAIADNGETITVTLGDITGGGFEAIEAGANNSVTTVINDQTGTDGTPGTEDTVRVNISGPDSVVEGETTGKYTVSLTQKAETPVTVKLTYSGTATDGTDYTKVVDVVIPAGQDKVEFDITTLDDAIADNGETITVTLGDITGGGFEAIEAGANNSVTTVINDQTGTDGTPGTEDTVRVNISGPDSVVEGETTGKYTVSLTQKAETPVTVKLTYSGTATDGTDYTKVVDVVIPAGQDKVEFDITTLDDAIADNGETITVTLGDITGGGFEAIEAGANNSVTTVINDQTGTDGTPGTEDTVRVNISGPDSVVEGETTGKYTVSLTQKAETPVTVKLTYSGTATDGTDYTKVVDVVIPAGQDKVEFDITTLDDAIADNGETITVTLGDITGGGFEAIEAGANNSVTTVINDQTGTDGTPGTEDTVRVNISGPDSVVEGETTGKYTVSLTQKAETPVTVKLTYSGTATDGTDYTKVVDVVIPAGQDKVEFDITTLDDAIADNGETITVTLGDITGGGFEAIEAGANNSVTTVINDQTGTDGTPGTEDTVRVNISGPDSVVEGETTGKYTVSLTQKAETPVTVKLTYSGTATDGTDYTKVVDVVIPAGQDKVEFDITTLDDAIADNGETITVTLGDITGGGFEAIEAGANNSVTTVINDQTGTDGTPGTEDTVRVNISGPDSVVEGETTGKYTVSLTQKAETPVTVKLTYSGTATDGTDYTKVVDVVIPAGQDKVEFDITTLDDAIADNGETITVTLGDITGGGFEAIEAGANNSVTTVINDQTGTDGTPGTEDTVRVNISGPDSVVEGETTGKYTVSLTQKAETPVTVKLTYSGTATDGTDYTKVVDVVIPAGQDKVEFDITTLDDAIADNGETITVTLGDITGGGFEAIEAGANNSVTTVINDQTGTDGTPGTEDTVRVNISGPDSVVEGETTGKYTVSLTQKAETPVTVKLTYSGTATDGTDYTKVVDVVIPAGQDKVEFDITTLDDAIADNGETITVTLGDITGGGFEAIEAGANNSVTTVINDQTGTDGTPGTEDTVRVNISGPDSVVEGETTGKYTVSLTQKAETPVTVKLTYSGTATDGTDYTKVVDVVIPAGQDKVEFDITTLDDAIADNGETITVTLGDITGGGFEAIEAGANNSVTTVINDQTGTDGTPGTEDTVRVNISGPDSVVEGETTGKYTVSLTQKAETPVTVKLTYSGTATDGTDYTKVVDVVIPAGQDKVEFDITTLDDAIADNGETITVTLGDITGGGFEAIEAGANNSVTTVINDQTGTDGTPGTEDTVRVNISGPDSVVEGETTGKYTVSLTQKAETPVTVKLTYSGTATDGTDYTKVVDVVIPAGQDKVEFDITTLDDAIADNGETITVTLGDITGGGFEAIEAGANNSVTTVINDQTGTDGTPGTEDTVRVNISGPDSVVEGETTGKYTVSLTQKAETPVTVKLTYSGTATDGTDYTKVVDVVIPAGQDKVEFDITTLDDAIADNGETITVTLGDITGGGFEAIEAGANNSVTTVINDQTGTDGTPGTEDTVRVNISGPDSVVEGETTGKYTVSLTQKAETPVTVKLTYSGTATDGTDYTKVVDVVIPAGQDKVEFDITTLDDAIADNGETITVTLGDITGGGFEAIEAGANNSVTTVINDQTGTDGTPGTEDTVRVNISGPDSVVEGETTGKYTVSLTQKAETPVTVKLTYSGTATDGTDYTKVVDVVIPAGQDKVEFDITTLDDAIADNGETITVTLGDITGGGFEAIEAGANNSVTTVINDQTGTDGTPGTEDTVRVNISGPDSVVEGETTGKYTVSLTQKAETPVTVKLTYSGTATDGTDYTKVVDVVIPAGQDKVEFDITTLDDAIADNGETITVTLGDITGGGFEAIEAGANNSVTTVINDQTGTDGTPGTEDTVRVNISGPDSVVEGETTGKYTVSLTQKAETPVTVKLTYSGTATDGTDYTKVVDVVIPAGQDKVEFDITTLDDAIADNGETITVTLGDITGGGFEAIEAGANNSVTTVINDQTGTDGTPGTEDTVRVNISGPDSVVEGETTGKYTVSLTQKAETPVTVKLTYSGTATDGTDYTKVVDVVIPAGQDKVEFDITTLDDAIADNGETITVTLGDITGGGFEAIEAGANNSVTTVINDQTGTDGTPGTEDTVRVNISGPDSVVEGETTGKYTVSLTQKAETPVTVKLTYSGTATDGTDYTKVVDVVIPAGQDKVEFDITTLDDAIADNGETITVTLGDITGGGFEAIEAGANNSVTTVINDQTGTDGTPGTEDTVRVNISGPDSVVEGETTGKYTVSLTQKAETPVTVKLTYSGTATDGTDYTKVVDVVIPAGQDKVEFDITTLDDAIADNGETITVTLGDITGGGFEAIEAGANNSVTTVINDQTGTDGTPGTEDTVRVNISGPDSVVEGETTGKYTVSLTQKAETPVTVKLTYSGTATDGTDYTKVVDVVIPAGQDKVEFDITTLDDAIADNGETITVTLGDITGGGFEAIEAGANNSVTTVINDNDINTVNAENDGSAINSLNDNNWGNLASKGITITAHARPLPDADGYTHQEYISHINNDPGETIDDHLDGNKLGVNDEPRGQVPNQIQYDHETGTSEAIKVSLNPAEPISQAVFSVSNLIHHEGGGERGRWTTLDAEGNIVDSGMFKLSGENSGSFLIDSDKPFTTVIFEALPYAGGDNGSGDSSDYYITDIALVTDDILFVKEGESLVQEDSSHSILANDSDPEGHHFTLTTVDNLDVPETGTLEVPVNQGDVTGTLIISADGTYTFNADNSDQLGPGEIAEIKIPYTITDDYDATDSAYIIINVVGVNTPPTALDTTVNLDGGQADILLAEMIADVEDGPDGINGETVVIRSLPEHGTLYYRDGENEVEITQADIESLREFNSDDLVYKSDLNTDNLLLGNTSENTQSLDMWGNAVSSHKREMDLGDGYKATLTSNSGPLTAYDNQQNHIGVGVADDDNNGINSGENLSLEFHSPDGKEALPVTGLTIGLDGLGGHFDQGGSDGKSAFATIEVYLEGQADPILFRYQKDGDYGNTELFQTVTVGNGPQFDINIGNGIISKVEFSTDSEYDSNWELRFVDIQVNDSFDYAAVDSNGAVSEDATVSVTSTSSDSTSEQLNLELNEADLSPDSAEQAKAQFSDENTTFIQSSTPETSGLVANASITWQLVGDLWTGSIEGENVITLSLNNGEITANLLGAIPHINEPDSENQPVKVIVQTSSGLATVTVKDDVPEIGQITHGDWENVYHYSNSVSFTDDSQNLDDLLEDAPFYVVGTGHSGLQSNVSFHGSHGIGITSTGTDNKHEINFQHSKDNPQSPEKITLFFKEKSNNDLKILFGKVNDGSTPNKVNVEFYSLDGTKVSSEQAIIAKNKGNDGELTFSSASQDYDYVVISPMDNGNKNQNSSFTIKSIDLVDSTDIENMPHIQGNINIDWGADGMNSLAVNSDDYTINLQPGSTNSWTARSNNEDIFTFTVENGQWKVIALKPEKIEDDIELTITATDSDNDSDSVELVIPAPSAADVARGYGGDDHIEVLSSDKLYYVTGDFHQSSGIPVSPPSDNYMDFDSSEGAILVGGWGNDQLVGGAGDDILIGGENGQVHSTAGKANGHFVGDWLKGGGGDDTFTWQAGDDVQGKQVHDPNTNMAYDVIADFSQVDGNSDRLDLSDLLQNEENGDLSDYLTISTLEEIRTNNNGQGPTGTSGFDGDSTVLLIDRDGTGSEGQSQMIILQNVNHADLMTDSNQGVIENLLLDGALIVDSNDGNVSVGGNSIELPDLFDESL
ncbi:type I secretion C-terminal target domain-containing protein [Parasalinivibrio latis]|uniref:immunoglobulin-like domain-containing protein n=1 Tax=Parasalinivibrio latis TaxID=2952610 RepID=UPI0030E0429C